MKTLLGFGLSGALVGGLYAAGTLSAGEVYDLPASEVTSRLASMPIPLTLLRVTGGSDATTVEVRRSAEAISWNFMLGDERVSTLTARLSPEGDGRTRVVVNQDSIQHPSPEIQRLASTQLAGDLIELGMAELVDARLEGREPDSGDVMQRLALHTAEHPEQVREYGRAVGDMMADLGNQARANAEADGAYRHETSPSERMEAATKPSLQLRQQ